MSGQIISNTDEFFIVQSYYNIVWSSESIEKLKGIFTSDVVLSYRAIDDPSKNFDKQGEEALNFYRDWARIAKRAYTYVNKFSLKTIEKSSYIINYSIVQVHGSVTYHMEFEELMTITDMKISKINLNRIHKIWM